MRKVYKKIKGFFRNDKVQHILIFILEIVMITWFIFLGYAMGTGILLDEKNDTNNIVANTTNLTQVNTFETLVYSSKNLAVPDLKGKEYLGDDEYLLINDNGVILVYNILTGLFKIKGTPIINKDLFLLENFNLIGNYVLNVILIETNGNYFLTGRNIENDAIYYKTQGVELISSSFKDLRVYLTAGTNVELEVKLQIEKGATATDYQVPLQPYLWHERGISYEFGREDGYDEGREDYGRYFPPGSPNGMSGWYGYQDGYQKGLEEGDIQMEDFQRGYERGREDYGRYFPPGSPNGLDGWRDFQDGYDLGYDEGYDYGYDKGFPEGQAADFGFTTLLASIFVGMGSFLAINILPGISIGAIVAVPIVFGIIYFIIGRKKE